MKTNIFLVIFFSTLLVGGCTAWNPKMGMTIEQFDSMCRKSFNGKSIVIATKNNYEIRQCQNMTDITYVFEGSRLISVEKVAVERVATESPNNQMMNSVFVTAVCSTLSRGKAAECAVGSLNYDETDLARKLRQQDDEIEDLKRQQVRDRTRQRQKDSEIEYEKRRDDLNKWKPSQN